MAKHFKLRAGGTTPIVYADNIESPLALRWKQSEILVSHLSNFTAFIAIDGGLGRLDVSRGPSFHLNETKYIRIPAN